MKSKKFVANGLKEVEEALADPNKTITDVKITIPNVSKRKPLSETGFKIPDGFILSMYKKAKESNAKNIEVVFKNCRTLALAKVTIRIDMPEDKSDE